jgi:hypothetical protein
VRGLGRRLVPLPPYAPGLHPAGRVFEQVRRAVEGRVWGTIEAKVEVVEAVLQRLARSPERVQHLAGWSWITDTLDHLPPPQPFPAAL